MACPCLVGKADPHTGVSVWVIKCKSLAVQSGFRIGPIAKFRRRSLLSILALWSPRKCESIALPDRLHRFIPLVVSSPRRYLHTRDGVVARQVAVRKLLGIPKEDRMTVDTGRRNALLSLSSVAFG